MARLRLTASRIALVWLLCQGASLALAPAILWFGSAEHVLECTCTHGDHAVCPMHHKPAPDSKLCLMGSAGDHGAAVLTSLFGGVGLLPAQTIVECPESQRAIVFGEFTTRSLRPPPPDPPPPRI